MNKKQSKDIIKKTKKVNISFKLFLDLSAEIRKEIKQRKLENIPVTHIPKLGKLIRDELMKKEPKLSEDKEKFGKLAIKKFKDDKDYWIEKIQKFEIVQKKKKSKKSSKI